MRSPVVKSQTPPRRGFLAFCRCNDPGVIGRAPCSNLISLSRSSHRCLHHTPMEPLAPWPWRVQRSGRAVLCGLETYPCPPTGPGTGVGQRCVCQGVPGSGGGRTHGLGARLAISQEPERMSNQRPRDQGQSA